MASLIFEPSPLPLRKSLFTPHPHVPFLLLWLISFFGSEYSMRRWKVWELEEQAKLWTRHQATGIGGLQKVFVLFVSFLNSSIRMHHGFYSSFLDLFVHKIQSTLVGVFFLVYCCLFWMFHFVCIRVFICMHIKHIQIDLCDIMHVLVLFCISSPPPCVFSLL